MISLEADAAGTASAVMQLFTRTNKFRKQTNIKRIFFVTSAALRRESFAIFRGKFGGEESPIDVRSKIGVEDVGQMDSTNKSRDLV